MNSSLLSKDPLCEKFISLYDVLGYNSYSPFFEEGKQKTKGEISKFFKKNSNLLGKKIYDLGCGGGIWSFFLEDLEKEVIGIDNDKNMYLLFQEYKEIKSKKAEFILGNILEVDYKKHNTSIMMDNTITSLNNNELKKLLSKLKNKTPLLIIELYKNKLKEGIFEYKFNSFDIKETVKEKSQGFYERLFLNKQTGNKIKIKTYKWEDNPLKNILEDFGEVSVHETKNSNLFILEFIRS